MHGRVHDLSGEERRQLAERLAAALASTAPLYCAKPL
ncbi:hypothetical protein HRbin33_01454 [bacterium HR33]|nr:hypothetical protein HRbin33_01454 [bacterium HR33]